jgi:putative radical SAM enzyme (TIGR03279 family)
VIPDGVLKPGDDIVAINGQPLRDVIDAGFYAADEHLILTVHRPDGSEVMLEVDKDPDVDLGIEFEPDRIRFCKANCDFCFVRQQPGKMRRALYIKDDDYRLSFLHGNFITLTNMIEDDYQRLFEQRLSPLYISVHATDDDVRRRFLRKPDTDPILPLLKRLHKHGIDTHAQIVVTPGLNDGDTLWRSFDDLLALYPNVPSVGVVPVGLTRYRNDLPDLRLVDADMARDILDQIDLRHHAMRVQHGVGAIYAADEMLLIAGRDIPQDAYYDDYWQLENGIGLVRQLLDGFEDAHRSLPERTERPLHIGVITGVSAAPFVTGLCHRVNRKVRNLRLDPLVIRNRFWGETVTVSGLLTGQDIADQFLASGVSAEALALPPDCLNGDGLFLDDETPESLSHRLGLPVWTSSYDFVSSVCEWTESGRSAGLSHQTN